MRDKPCSKGSADSGNTFARCAAVMPIAPKARYLYLPSNTVSTRSESVSPLGVSSSNKATPPKIAPHAIVDGLGRSITANVSGKAGNR